MKTNTHLLTRSKYRIVFCAAAVILQFIPCISKGAGWSIDPIRIELSPSKPTAAMTFTNDTDQPTVVQIQVAAWSQEGGKDTLTPTKELLVTPPIVTIAPKSVQIIRMTLRRPADPTKELAYRINLQELPTPTAINGSAIQVAMRVGIPVFVQSIKGDAIPKMSWKVSVTPENMVKVALHNDGNAHVQISDFSLYSPGYDHPIANETSSSYILAGQSHEWLLKSSTAENVSAGHLRLKAFTDSESVDKVLVVDKP